jgi:hypothetical protein
MFLTKWAIGGRAPDPVAIATDANNNVYVADSSNELIRKFTSGGTSLTKWGRGLCGFEFRPGAIATDAAGNVYVVNFGTIQKFGKVPFDTSITSGPFCGGAMNDPTPTIRFSAGIPGPTFECKIDSGTFTPCTSPFTAPRLADGFHDFYVRGRTTDYVDPTPARAFFVLDTTPVAGPYVTAKKKQVQKGRLIKIKVEAGALPAVTVRATGKVKVKGKQTRTYQLKPVIRETVSNYDWVLRLIPAKRKHNSKIFNALDKGKKARAPIWVKLTNDAGNSVREKRVVRLTRRG